MFSLSICLFMYICSYYRKRAITEDYPAIDAVIVFSVAGTCDGKYCPPNTVCQMTAAGPTCAHI